MKFKSLALALSVAALSSATMASGNETKTLSTISFTGTITKPTCVVVLDNESIELPTLATTAFKGKGTTAGEAVNFTVKLQQTADNGGQAGEACPSVSVAGSDTETPNIEFSLSDADLTADKKYLANKANESATIGVQIFNSEDKLIDFNNPTATESVYKDGVLAYKARYVALAETVAEQQISASMSFSVIYK